MLDIHWYGQDAFRIVDEGKQLYFDPYQLPDGLPAADYVFVTHDHGDHYSPHDVAKVRGDTTRLVAPADVAQQVGEGAIALGPGQSTRLDALQVAAIAAYNTTKFRSPGVPFHPREKGWVGYLVTLSDGTVVYHAGDTDFVPEMRTLAVDVALLPVSGTYVMTADEAVEAANAFRPKLAVPMHYGAIVGSEADAQAFRAGFTGDTLILRPESTA